MSSVKPVEEGPLRLGSHVKVKQPKCSDRVDGNRTCPRRDAALRVGIAQRCVRSTGVHEVTTRNGTTHLRLELDQAGVLAGVVGLVGGGLIKRYMDMEAQGIKKCAEELA